MDVIALGCRTCAGEYLTEAQAKAREKAAKEAGAERCFVWNLDETDVRKEPRTVRPRARTAGVIDAAEAGNISKWVPGCHEAVFKEGVASTRAMRAALAPHVMCPCLPACRHQSQGLRSRQSSMVLAEGVRIRGC